MNLKLQGDEKNQLRLNLVGYAFRRMKHLKLLAPLFALVYAGASPSAHAKPVVKPVLRAEIGALGVLSHMVQVGKNGSRIDYRKDAGQENLFPYFRFEAGISIGCNHQIEALYQPLDLVTRSAPVRPLNVDGVQFAAGQPMRFRYGFSFYRLSYFYKIRLAPKASLSLGGAAQIRNATLEFEALNGNGLRTRRDLGFVPLLGLRAHYAPTKKLWFGTEVVGFYAPIRYLNGGKSDVEGAIFDASLRMGMRASNKIYPYLNLRWVGGGAQGTSSKPKPIAPPLVSDGYTKNWLYLMSLSIGVRFQ